MSTSALLAPAATSALAAADAADRVVRTLVRLAAEEGRRCVERLESLVALESLGERAEPVLGAAVWAAEAGCALGLSEATVRRQTARARRILAVPALVDALRLGAVGPVHVDRVLEVLAGAPEAVAARVCAQVLYPLCLQVVDGDEVRDLPSPARLAARVRRAWYALEPEAVAAERRDAVGRRAWWTAHLSAPGVSMFGGSGPAEAVEAARVRLAVAVSAPPEPGDLRTRAQREVDLALALLVHGTLAGLALPPAPVQLLLHAPAETVASTSDEPGLLVGVGHLDAEHCRSLATTATAIHTVAVDPVSRQPRAPAASEPGYRPSTRLARLVRARHPQSVAPTSTVWRTDLDHTVPWPRGGTSAANLAPLDRRWHRLKQAGFRYRLEPDGAVTWTSPRGRSYRVPPTWSRPAPRSADPP